MAGWLDDAELDLYRNSTFILSEMESQSLLSRGSIMRLREAGLCRLAAEADVLHGN